MAMPELADAEEPTDDTPLEGDVVEEIYDPVAAVAREAKAKGKKGFRFTVGGEVFQMKSPQQLGRQTLKRIELLHADEDIGGIEFLDAMFKGLLGAEAFVRFDEVADLSIEEMEALLAKSTEYYGISVPESSASTGSSKKKRKR